jgi:hypothetical protein
MDVEDFGLHERASELSFLGGAAPSGKSGDDEKEPRTGGGMAAGLERLADQQHGNPLSHRVNARTIQCNQGGFEGLRNGASLISKRASLCGSLQTTDEAGLGRQHTLTRFGATEKVEENVH